MADKKSKAAAKEDIVYAPEATTPITQVSASDDTKLNALSVVSIASSATGFCAVAGIITGHVALSQLRHTAEKGRGLAIAGLITGYVGLAGFALMSTLAIGGHWAQDRFDGPRNGFANGQISNQQGTQQGGQFGGMRGGHFGGRGQDDNGFGAFGGQSGQVQGQSGNIQVGPGQMGQGGITLDSNGGSTITLPNGQTITIPDGPGMMGGPNAGNGQVQPTPLPSGVQGN